MNMFRQLGQEAFHVSSFGNRIEIILVEDKDNNLIYCKDEIPLGNKVYLIDETMIGTVEGSKPYEDKEVGNIFEISLAETFSKVPVTITEIDLTSGTI